MPKDKEDFRPDPDELLERLQKESLGKMTVFLGAAAGVGKTYAMLEAAHDRLREGVDVRIGWIETHGRVETEKLVKGLPHVQHKILIYKEREMKEMDIDAILAEKPTLVLVDELAHTNVRGSRHYRRFQDVLEILKAGIDVYTTLNIQHVESLNDVVAQITGIIVHETVPDFVLEQADNVQLVDLTPEELIKRLKEGKVYIPSQAERALKKFFRPGNINALRELSLRYTASRVDRELTDYMKANQIDGPWPASRRVMVCVGGSPFSAKVVRTASRLATGQKAELIALHVRKLSVMAPGEQARHEQASASIRLAEELGAKVVTVVGENIVSEMIDMAKSLNVTAIVIGKPNHSRLHDLLYGSIVDTLIRKSGGVNVFVVQNTLEDERLMSIQASRFSPLKQISIKPRKSHVLGGLAMVVIISALGIVFKNQLELVNIALLYFVPVLMTALWWGRWASYITAFASILAFDFLFIPPILRFTVNDVRYIWSFLIFMFVSYIIGGRTEVLRYQAKSAKGREVSIRALYEFSKEITAINDVEHIAIELTKHSSETLNLTTLVFIPDEWGKLHLQAAYDIERLQITVTDYHLDDSETAVAAWAFQNGRSAGACTDTLPGSKFLYVPMVTGGKTNGIFGVDAVNRKIGPEEKQLINAWAGLAAIAVERVTLAEQAHQAVLLVESERLRNALFNSISHELRTPLSTITGATSTLLDRDFKYNSEVWRELLETVQEGAGRMERVVINLLDTARIESGMLKLKTDWCDMEDIVGTALHRIGEAKAKYKIKVNIQNDLGLIRGDGVLLEQVVLNLVDNAMKYSAPDSTIIISVAMEGTSLRVSVIDNGTGILEGDINKIFEKFYRSPHPGHITGTGLGLSISKSIIDAHGGEIWASNRSKGGAVVGFTLPLQGDDIKALPMEMEFE